MSDIIPRLTADDFKDRILVMLNDLPVSGQVIADAALSSQEGVGHVIDNGNGTWTPIWRERKSYWPKQPVGFPETQVGYGPDMATVIERLRNLNSIVWSDGKSDAWRMLLVFDSPEDAAAFGRVIEQSIADAA